MSQVDRRRLGYWPRVPLLIVSLGPLAALLLAGLNELAPRQCPLSFALVFLGWSLLFYSLLLAPLGLASRLGSAGRYVRAALAPLSLVLLLLCTAANAEAVERIFHLHGPARFRYLVPLGFLAASASLASAGWLSARRLWAGYSLGAVALFSAALAFWPQSRSIAAGTVGRSAVTPQDPDARFVLIGLDGADWRYIEPLIARGEMPNIASLRDRGTWGPLATFKPRSRRSSGRRSPPDETRRLTAFETTRACGCAVWTTLSGSCGCRLTFSSRSSSRASIGLTSSTRLPS